MRIAYPCFQAVFNKQIAVLQRKFEAMQAQRQQGHLSLLYLVKTKQLGNSVLSACLKGVKLQELPFPMQKILYRLPY